MSKKYVYEFAPGRAEGRGSMKELLGGKGAGLAEMARLGLPVPPGFTITTEACLLYFERGRRLPPEVARQTHEALRRLEAAAGERFGDPERPLLVSVRSGSRASMPGMMDTVLNLGLNDVTVEGLARRTGNRRFALDAYRRLLALFGAIVLGVPKERFDSALEAAKKGAGVKSDAELDAGALEKLVSTFKRLTVESAGRPFPEDPGQQLEAAIGAVFGSWFGERAKTYRRINGLPEDWGTAANVVTMVFGNMGPTSGTGVAFTRDPGTGERRLFAEVLFDAQGEDVVSGVRTPLPLSAFAERLPQAHAEFVRHAAKLEKHYRDMLDIEFTIQEGRLYMLQVRVGKRTAAAAVRMAVEMAGEKLIDKRTAVLRVKPEQLDQLLHPTVAPGDTARIFAKGLAASPGAAVGKVVFTAAAAEAAALKGERVVLVRPETSPEDIGGMHAAQGILTARGGMTSHAAVVARGMGRPCVAGCSAIQFLEGQKAFEAGGVRVAEGDVITLNGSTGEVILGEARLVRPDTGPYLETLLHWADSFRALGVRANADTPEDARTARKLGAEGIGLCRTEHMFFAKDRILAVREMILAEGAQGRKPFLETLMPMQRGDFEALFKEMAGLPVTIRLLDPPLHEFLPTKPEELEELAREMGVELGRLTARNKSLQEFNPMIGHRGCRVGITFPDIYEMQVRAIVEAACDAEEAGIVTRPEIMLPLVAEFEELARLKALALKTIRETLARRGRKIAFAIGTMIEIPRAALLADRLAREAEFFSFGTNDLTQTTWGLSRDDAGTFLPAYLDTGVLKKDPFVTLDQDGVGALMRHGVRAGRRTRPELEIGICGEVGGDPDSIAFCHSLGMDYVSCSPYRVPLARLAAAHAALRNGHPHGKEPHKKARVFRGVRSGPAAAQPAGTGGRP